MKNILKRLIVLISCLLFIPAMFFYMPTIGIGGAIVLGIYWVFTGKNVEDQIVNMLMPIETMHKLIKRILE